MSDQIYPLDRAVNAIMRRCTFINLVLVFVLVVAVMAAWMVIDYASTEVVHTLGGPSLEVGAMVNTIKEVRQELYSLDLGPDGPEAIRDEALEHLELAERTLKDLARGMQE